MRVGILSRVRLLSEAIAAAFAVRNPALEIVVARTIPELDRLARAGGGLELVIVDVLQPIDLAEIRQFHCDFPDLPLLALGIREHEGEIIAHGRAGFSCYLRREDGIDSLCAAVEDALEGRLSCSPEIAAAMMRALFGRGPIPVPRAATPLTRRENEVARLVSRALSNKEIARELELSESTVKHHVHAVLGKFGVATRSQLMRNMREDLWPAAAAARSGGERV